MDREKLYEVECGGAKWWLRFEGFHGIRWAVFDAPNPTWVTCIGLLRREPDGTWTILPEYMGRLAVRWQTSLTHRTLALLRLVEINRELRQATNNERLAQSVLTTPSYHTGPPGYFDGTIDL